MAEVITRHDERTAEHKLINLETKGRFFLHQHCA